MEEEVEQELPNFHMITVMVTPNSPPQVDLGDVPPEIALCIFQQAVIALEELMTLPTIMYEGEVIFRVHDEA